MIVSGALNSNQPVTQPDKLESVPDAGGSPYAGRVMTKAKQVVSPELAKKVHTYYRCINGISDDIASMPLQLFSRVKATDGLNLTYKVDPSPSLSNIAYLLEVQPNRWMTPFVFKKTAMMWMLAWGTALIWQPAPPAQRELFILPTNQTQPKLDANGYLWYQVTFPNGERRFIPSIEVTAVMINSTNGLWGRSVLEYAAETLGLRMGMAATASAVQGSGFNPAAYVQVSGEVNKQAREKLRESYSEAIGGAENAGRLAVFDNKITKFEPISMKLTDAQFLESMDHTDIEIANFFKYPAYKLNLGKQSYESNSQQDLDYLKSCLDPLLVQFEQSARLHWLSESEQQTNYFKFIRESILRTDAKSRAELHAIQISSGTLTPNESREIDDRNGYEAGDRYYMSSQNLPVMSDLMEAQDAPVTEDSEPDQGDTNANQ